MAYSKILRRQRSEKTNYKKRGIMLMGKRDFITVVITNENAQVQILTPNITAGYDKLLGGGSTSVAYSINVRRCTESAKVKLEKAGGNVTVLEKVVPKEVQTTNG